MLDLVTKSEQARQRSDADRAALALVLADLRQRLAKAPSLSLDGAAGLARQAGEGALALCRRHPAAVGLTLAGLGWLALSSQRAGRAACAKPVLAGTKFEAMSRWADDGGPVATAPEADPEPETEDDWLAEAEGLRRRLASQLSLLDRAARNALAPAAEIARHRAALAADHAADLSAAFRSGLTGLSAAAQDRIAAAREAAFRAGETAAEGSARLARRHPLTLLAAAWSAGAALAAALPGTAVERRNLSPLRQHLLDEAHRLLAEERARARRSG